MEKISIYLAGNIQKGHENESLIYWSGNDLKKIRETLSFVEITFLNPAIRNDNLSDQKSVFVKISNGSLEKKDHVYSILLVSEKTGSPVSAKYIDATKVQSDDKGIVTGVTLSLEENDFTGRARVYYMVDTYPAAKGLVTVK